MDDLSTEMKGTDRKLKQGISDLEQTAKALEKRLKEIGPSLDSKRKSKSG